MVTIEDAILRNYRRHAKTNRPDIDLLFDVTSRFIKEKKWIYEGNAESVDIYKRPENERIKANCFMLADLFVHLAKRIGISSDECFPINIPNFCSTKNSSLVQGDYQPFSPTCTANTDGLYEFDVHCIAMINGSYFDLLLQVTYSVITDGADIYSSLSTAMDDNNICDFEYLLNFFPDKNEQAPDTGHTLLHKALWEEKFDFAVLLLKHGAQDNIMDNIQLTPLSLLNIKIYDPRVSLETLGKAKEYLDTKMELMIKNRKKQLEVENKAAISIQRFWRSHHTSPAPSVSNEDALASGICRT
ncbi:ankyrin repeat domain-containing protein [Legionella genomosp. 1]|uniref:ankyrin repeat domain-containing protein n=1 Tax=Legionella genomosp. 1 TaxID=1093625 RepID=UPI0010549660|nr:ankyrin repeat domain-containing protein [Legionella genomosp. 1]